VANGLIGSGVRPQDRVVYLGRNRAGFFEVTLGTSMAGGVSFAVNELDEESADFIDALPRNRSGKGLKRELRSSLGLADTTAWGAT
jgi:acyl-CoA synthetase (AMP-forming)/AMP-acid ligase II